LAHHSVLQLLVRIFVCSFANDVLSACALHRRMAHSNLSGRKRPLQGVSWDPKRGNFKVRIHYNGQEKFIGR
jgi:hypothetical protein